MRVFVAGATGVIGKSLMPLLPKGGVSLMTQNRGASNAKAKRELGWQLLYPSWRQGFVDSCGKSA